MAVEKCLSLLELSENEFVMFYTLTRVSIVKCVNTFNGQDAMKPCLYSFFRTSGHLIIEGGKTSRNPQDFTSIPMENLNFIFLRENTMKPV